MTEPHVVPERTTRPGFAAGALMIASGFAGLGYQIVWTQQSALALGQESAAVLAVVAAFFGGLAVGAFAFGRLIEATSRPLRWYVGAEAVIAMWSGALTLIMTPYSGWILRLIGVQPSPIWQWSVSFIGTFLILLPATAAMGATLPAMERMTSQWRTEGRSIAALYASNTLGAVVGVLATAFFLIPEIGLTHTAEVCIALNAFCAVAASVLFAKTAETMQSESQPTSSGRALLVRLAATGLLGIGYEVLVVRVLSQVTEDTVYTFAMLLAVYLIGSSFGAAAYQRWRKNIRDFEGARDALLIALALACLLGTGLLWFAEAIKAQSLQWLGAGMGAAIGSEAALALIAFGLPTIVMGALFSHLANEAGRAGVGFGRALASNTFGAALAPLCIGVLFVTAFGLKYSLLLVGAGYLSLLSLRTVSSPKLWAPAAAALAVTFGLAIATPPLAFINVPDGGHVVSYREGAMAAVSVVEDANGIARLRINNRQQEGTSATRRVDGRQGLLPILLHPSPERVLFLGLGTGITASSAALDPTIEVDAVELLPEVIEASSYFVNRSHALTLSRFHVFAADARRYVRASERHYDVIIADNFHPARSGSGALYTVEHFAAVHDRLTDQGVFCQWLPLHQLDVATLKQIVRSFIAVFPDAAAMLASNSLETPVVGLVGRRGERFDFNALSDRVKNAMESDGLADFGIEDEFALLGGFIGGPEALKRFAGDAPLNTDDRPIVAYRAPRITYAPDSLPRDRLATLLRDVWIEPKELLAHADDQASERLGAYWVARNRFIDSGRDVRPTSDVRGMLAQVREPLLSVLHISPDFRPAYDPLLRMAMELWRTDIVDARGLLNELIRTQPARPEAASVLRQLGAQRASE